MTKTKLKRGDTKAIFTETLGVDLTGATVKFHLRGDGILVRQNATIVSPSTAGQVSYQIVASDVTIPGQYRQEWEVTFANGSIQTFPVDDYNEVTIIDDLNPL